MSEEMPSVQLEYGWVDYVLDVNLVRRFEELQRRHKIDPTMPWEEDSRKLLRTRERRLRTGPGHMPVGPEASFSDVYSEDVTDKQAYAVLAQRAEAARERVEDFRAACENVGKGSSLEQILYAVRIAEMDADRIKTSELTYMLGEMLVNMNKTDMARARRILGNDLVKRAYAKVKPVLL